MKNKNNFLIVLLFICSIPNCYSQAAAEFKKYQDRYSGSPIIFLANEEHVEINLKKGALDIYTRTHEKMLLLQDNAGIYGNGSVYYSGWSPLVDLSAKTLVPEGEKFKTIEVKNFNTKDVLDGSIFHNDAKEKTFFYPSLSKGSHMVLDYTLHVTEPRFFHPFIFGSYCPIEKSVYTVTFPASVEIAVVYKNATPEELNFTKTESKGKITYSWTKEQIDKIEGEYSAPSFRYYTPHVIVYIKSYEVDGKKQTMLDGVGALHDFYMGFIENLNTGDDSEIVAIVDSITKGIESDDEKAKKIFQWVQDHIKYVAFEAGLEGFVPAFAESVCSKRYGDCKGMANLTTKMLNIANIEAHLTWIGTRDIPYTYDEVPTPISDNHMIAAYKSNGEYIFLDATASYVPYGLPTPFIQGKEALINIGNGKFEIVKVPEVNAEQNILEEKMRLHIEGDKVVGNSTSRYTGFVKMQFNDLFKNVTPKDKLKVMDAIYEIGNNTFSLDTMYEENLNDRDKDMFVHYKFNIKNYAKFTEDKIFINLTPDKDLSRDKVKDDRIAPLENDFKRTMKRTVIFEIPVGFTPEYIPENTSYEHPLFHYSINYTTSGNTITMNSVAVVNNLLMEQEQFAAWNEMISKLNTAYSELVILKKQ